MKRDDRILKLGYYNLKKIKNFRICLIYKLNTYEIFGLLPIMQRTLIMQRKSSLHKEGWEWGRLVNIFLLAN